MVTKYLEVDREEAKEIFDLNDQVVAVRQVITNSVTDSSSPILPDNPYHKAYVAMNGELVRKRYTFMMKYFPQLENTEAAWSIDTIVAEGESQFVRLTIPEELAGETGFLN